MASEGVVVVLNASEEPNSNSNEKPLGEMTLPERQEHCRKFAELNGYSLTIGPNVRKYGGPPPDGSERPRGAEIFLGRLPPTVFEDELVPLLETYGKIWEMRILLAEKTELGRGFAFATFYEAKVAQTVVRQLTNKPLPGHPGINFSISLSKPHSLVMIKNLPKNKTRAAITRDFEGFFEGMLGVNIWGVEGRPPVLWASLEFGSERAAAGALGQLLAGEIQPYYFKLDAYYSTCDHNENSHIVVLHVRNLPENATEEGLHAFFAHYPAFERARIINKFAFIHFRDHVSAERALQEQYGAPYMGRPLEMAWARTKTFVPQPPPPLPVSKRSEERLYAFAPSSGGGPQRGGANRPPGGRDHPYDGPPRDQRRSGPPSRGAHRGRSPPGRRNYSPPPPSYYDQRQADYRPPQSYDRPSRPFDGPSGNGNGYGGFQLNYPVRDDRPRLDSGHGYNQTPQHIDRGYDAARGPPPASDHYNRGNPQVPGPNYVNQWQQPAVTGSYNYYNQQPQQADHSGPAVSGAYNDSQTAPASVASFNYGQQAPQPAGQSNGGQRPAAGSGKPAFAAQQNGWEG
ncbi:putative Heterogeneous nuclear ribonucleoprotein Q [Hypsibius exemplaris]|uniref:Heterogeneous nuclear ribonucleoprotein Q n=1 Tax=Hypsibius exemplaris TaxID=2072580 RepID=A0A1W0WRF6_HYPEX|nr:putative Heterogeneous nuclear ribonucleoprotein Q [Hypsibius exemplaris]